MSSEQPSERSQHNDDGRVEKREQIDWANDCNDLQELAKSAEAKVRREDYEGAHEKLSKLSKKLEGVREEYPRYIHAGAEQEDTEG